MRKLPSVLAIAAILSSCQASPPVFGEYAFAVDKVARWNEAQLSSCEATNGNHLYLFGHGEQFYLITQYSGAYDVAYFELKGGEFEIIDANGGLGRYAELENSVVSMRALPTVRVRRNQFGQYIKSQPERGCNF